MGEVLNGVLLSHRRVFNFCACHTDPTLTPDGACDRQHVRPLLRTDRAQRIRARAQATSFERIHRRPDPDRRLRDRLRRPQGLQVPDVQSGQPEVGDSVLEPLLEAPDETADSPESDL